MKISSPAARIAALLITSSLIGCKTSQTRTSYTDMQTLLQDDQSSIARAQDTYRSQVLKHGAQSEEAQGALNEVFAAQNKLQVDQQRVRQVQAIQFSSMTTTGASGTMGQPTSPPTPLK
jgi:hypothetical protein